jgi:filamentous hemagglutinin family protein
MTISIRNEQWWQKGLAFAAACTALFFGNSASAQIVPDRTLGAESSVIRSNLVIKGVPSDRIDGGAIRGANLFHSFLEFNVKDGRGAYFSNPGGIENIFSRVTGSNASNIYGKLGVLGNANLFLLNPNGIIFGPNASLDLGGSFVGSTANSFNFGGGKEFSATNPSAPPLLTVSVPLGVQFNQAQPSAVVNSGNLSVSTGKNLALLGGTVVSTGQLSAPGGQIALAAVPGGSVVNLSPSAQLLNIDTSSPVLSGGSFTTLTELLGSSDERSHPGLTVNGSGQVALVGSGLPVVDGDVVAKNVTAQTATLTAKNNLTLVESLLGTTGNLNLLAGNTVRVRDSVTNPFVAQAGGQLLVQGRQGVDIFALNNPSSGLVSGGDMVLRSANTVGGDAHYWAGGNFRIEKLDGSLGGLFSPYDPIIRASGDVSFESYSGGSLQILAGGSVTIEKTVTITDPDPTNGLSNAVLDIRSGTTAFSTPGLTPNPIPGISPSPPRLGSVPTSANIRIGSINVQPVGSGQVFLTNQYQPNLNLSEASIEIGDRTGNSKDFSITALGNPVTIDARGDVTIYQGVITGIRQGTGGDINILSGGNINLGEGIGQGDNPVRGSLLSLANTGNGGNITLRSAGNIRSGSIEASSNSDDIFSTITLKSLAGSVFLGSFFLKEVNLSITSTDNKVNLSTTNTGANYAGNIFISAGKNANNNIEIIDTNINTNGYFGGIFIDAGGKVSITDSVLTSQAVSSLPEPKTGITSQAGLIEVTSQTGNIEINNSSLFTSTASQFAFAGAIKLTANQGVISINKSDIRNRALNQDTGENAPQLEFAPTITLKSSSVKIIDSTVTTETRSDSVLGGNIDVEASSSVKIIDSTVTTTTDSDSVPAGDIDIDVEAGSVLLSGSGFTDFRKNNTPTKGLLAEATKKDGTAGNIFIVTDELTVENGATVTVSSPQGEAGNVVIFADKIRLNNGAIFASTGQNDSQNEGANIFLLGTKTTNNSLDYLLLSNQSLIQANAFSSANGGNISITTRLLLALPPTGKYGNDISANAQGGRGGVVAIDPRPFGIYGTEFRPKTTHLNDITASSEQGPQGTVAIVPLNVDPRRGLFQLPEKLRDSSKLITQSCPVGRTQSASRFIVAGRGGLPPSPSSALSSDAVMGNTTTNGSSRETRLMQSSSSSILVEAKGVNIGPNGEILLTANPSKLTSDNSWQRNTDCNAQ